MIKLTGRVSATMAVFAALVCTGGCRGTTDLTNVQMEFASQIPDAAFHREVSLAIGPGAIALARGAMTFIPEARACRRWLTGIRRVEVSVYGIDAGDRPLTVATPACIEKMTREGWETAVRVRERGDAAWVLYRIDGDSVREVFVAAIDRSELVLVKVKGRHLERLIGRALADLQAGGRLGRDFRRGV